MTLTILLLQFYDMNGTAVVTTSPVVNQVYTTTDNTLLIQSLVAAPLLRRFAAHGPLFNGNACTKTKKKQHYLHD